MARLMLNVVSLCVFFFGGSSSLVARISIFKANRWEY
jgi:hypothetical protein